MKSAVTIDRRSGDGKYGDVIDVADFLGREIYGSAVNALAAMVRESQSYKKAKSRMKSRMKSRRQTTPSRIDSTPAATN